MNKAPKTIYLIQGEWDGETCLTWCDCPAPTENHRPSEAVEYVRKDRHDAIFELQAETVSKAADRIEQLETMVKVFRGCIETGVMPKQGSRCHKIVHELVGESEDE